MKKRFVLFSILILIFAIVLAVRFYFLRTQNTEGKLRVISSPNAEVFINDSKIGKTPFEGSLKTGEHILKLIPQSISTKSAQWEEKIYINRNSLTFVGREFGSSNLTSSGVTFTIKQMSRKPDQPGTGEIEIQTDPKGAIIFIDSEEQGIAPLIISNLEKGQHELSVYTPGFLRRTQRVNVDPGYRVMAKFKLSIDENYKKIDDIEKKEATESANITKNIIEIRNTETGWLRVRSGPSITATEEAKINPGEKFERLEEEKGWYKIEYKTDKFGWISAQYTKEVKPE